MKKAFIIYAAALASLSVVVLWVVAIADKSHMVAMMGAAYAILCSLFFGAQIFAFVRAHFDYDETLESPKFDVIKIEEEQWREFNKA